MVRTDTYANVWVWLRKRGVRWYVCGYKWWHCECMCVCAYVRGKVVYVRLCESTWDLSCLCLVVCMFIYVSPTMRVCKTVGLVMRVFKYVGIVIMRVRRPWCVHVQSMLALLCAFGRMSDGFVRVCKRVGVSVCFCVHANMHVHKSVCACMCACMCACVRVCVCRGVCACESARACACVCLFACVHECACVCACVRACVHVCLNVCM